MCLCRLAYVCMCACSGGSLVALAVEVTLAPRGLARCPSRHARAPFVGGGAGAYPPGDGADSGKVRSTVHDPDPKHWVPHKYTRFDNASIEFVSEILSAIEPITYSKFALRAIKNNKMRTLLEMLEFTTKVPRSTALVGDLRHIPSLKGKLMQHGEGVGARGHRLLLPPNWDEQGVFTLKADALDNIVVEHRYTKFCRPWPASLRLVDSEGHPISVSDLYIAGNYFEDAAEIKSSLTLEAFRIGSLGCFNSPDRPGQKRVLALMAPGSESDDGSSCKRPALEDGAASSAPGASTQAPSGTSSSLAGSAGEMASVMAKRRRSSARLSLSSPAGTARSLAGQRSPSALKVGGSEQSGADRETTALGSDGSVLASATSVAKVDAPSPDGAEGGADPKDFMEVGPESGEGEEEASQEGPFSST